MVLRGFDVSDVLGTLEVLGMLDESGLLDELGMLDEPGMLDELGILNELGVLDKLDTPDGPNMSNDVLEPGMFEGLEVLDLDDFFAILLWKKSRKKTIY